MRQYTSTGRNKDKKKVRANEKDRPTTFMIWFQGHKDPDSSVGENSLIYNGVIAEIIPIDSPSRALAAKST